MQEADLKLLADNGISHELQHEPMQNELTNLAHEPETPKVIKTNQYSRVAVAEKKKSSTAILCELTHLKSQQKHLECSQVKLNANNFIDLPDTPHTTPKCSPVRKTQSPEVNVAHLINDIESLKAQLDEELQSYKAKARADVEDFGLLVIGLKEDVFQPERLRQFSVQSIRERVIAANTQLERLHANNSNELAKLKEQFVEIDAQVQRLSNSF